MEISLNGRYEIALNIFDVREDGSIIGPSGRRLKERLDRKGRARIAHRKLGDLYIYRLVAEKFLPKERGKTDVHHKDHDITNNNISNLEWINKKEHQEHHLIKDWVLIDPYGNTIHIHNMKDYCRDKKLDPSHMRKVSKGIMKSYKGWTCKKDIVVET